MIALRTLRADTQAGPADRCQLDKVESPRPRASASADRRVAMRAPLRGLARKAKP
jgi:hypothetical protein